LCATHARRAADSEGKRAPIRPYRRSPPADATRTATPDATNGTFGTIAMKTSRNTERRRPLSGRQRYTLRKPFAIITSDHQAAVTYQHKSDTLLDGPRGAGCGVRAPGTCRLVRTRGAGAQAEAARRAEGVGMATARALVRGPGRPARTDAKRRR